MNNTANKKDIFYIIVLILTFITVVVGATFALYVWFFSQEEGTSAVYTGTFSVEYLFSDKIDFHYLTPREKPTIDTIENIYKNKLKITNTGSLDGRIDRIVIEINKNQFEDVRLDPNTKNKGIILKYSLYTEDEGEIISGNIGGNGIVSEVTIASNLELKSGETEEYILLIWLEDDGEDQNEYKDKEFEGTIRVDLFQEEYFK